MIKFIMLILEISFNKLFVAKFFKIFFSKFYFYKIFFFAIYRSHAERPWIRSNNTTSFENDKAKKAYQALKTISLRRSDLDEYKNFETRVKERAEKKYNYSAKTGKEYEV